MLAEMGHDESGQPITVALLLKDGDGTVHRYEKQPDGTYKAPRDVYKRQYIDCVVQHDF